MISIGCHASPKIVASTAPLHSLISSVTTGVTTPELIFDSGQSPHLVALSPSDIRSIHQADLVIWMGPGFEASMKSVIASLDQPEKVRTLLEYDDFHLLGSREFEDWHTGDEHDHGHDHDHHTTDPHIWLSIENSKIIVQLLSKWLSELDPENQKIYENNAISLIQDMNQLNQELSEIFEKLDDHGYLVFHDAYQYFEKEFNFNVVGAVTLSPERSPGAKQIATLRDKISAHNIKCIFSEPQFQSKVLDTLLEGKNAHKGILDPLGYGLNPGPQLWFELLRNLTYSIRDCSSQQ